MTHPHNNWDDILRKIDAYWEHPGHSRPDVPYIRISSKLICDAHFWASRLFERPPVAQRALGDLLNTEGIFASAKRMAADCALTQERSPMDVIDRVLGIAHSGINMSYGAANILGCKAGHVRRQPDGSLTFGNCPMQDGERILMMDDGAVTGGSLLALREAIKENYPNCKVLDAAAVVANFTGKKELDGLKIVSLISPRSNSWRAGHNPNTPNGLELVPPLDSRTAWKQIFAKAA